MSTHRAAEAAASEWDVKGLLGFELEARGGFMLPESSSPVTAPGMFPGGDTDGGPTGHLLYGSMNPYSYDPFAVALAAGYRFLPFLSAGLFFDYGNFQVNGGCDSATVECTDGTSQLQRQLWQFGLYGRYYLTTLSRRLHPWVELGVGASEDTASYTRILGGGGSTIPTTNYYLTYWGVVTNLRIGLDWRLSPWFSVGPFLGYSRTFALSGEVQVCPQSASETGNCDTTSPYYKDTSSSPVATSGYGTFFGGIFLKVTLGPSVR
ncbi:MAG TPA: autotransporter domain-containing protein [Polyangiaceae bacterium]